MSKLPLQIVLIKMECSHLICILTYLIYFNAFINRYICIKNKTGSHFLNWQRTTSGTTKCRFDSCSWLTSKIKYQVFFVFLNNMLSDCSHSWQYGAWSLCAFGTLRFVILCICESSLRYAAIETMLDPSLMQVYFITCLMDTQLDD